MNKGFSIQFVAKITGINAHTIRAWEKRYEAVVPERSDTGKRLYNQDNVDRLKKLHELVKLGNSISDIASLDDESLDNMYQKYIGSSNSANGITQQNEYQAKPKIDINTTLQHLVIALRSYKLDIISHELEKIKQALGPREFALNILSPLLSEVGELVDNGIINIAQEHSLSAILKFHIGHMLYKHLESKNKMDVSVAISTPEGELHEFGIMIAALLCSYYNVNFYYLGPNMPAESLAESCNQIGAKHLILGVSRVYHYDPSRNLDKYIVELKENLNEDTKLIIGGLSKGTNFLDQANIELVPTLHMLDQKLSSLIN
jgi:DNA-binding transcriptional MerR regulator